MVGNKDGDDTTLQARERRVLLEKMRDLQFDGITIDMACPVVGGTFDESGTCIVCLSDNCLVLADDLSAYSEEFCTTAPYPTMFERVTYCGTASCYLESLFAIQCQASFPILDHVLEGTTTCDLSLNCDCNGMTWDGQACSSCSGAAEGYDCQNVGGPVVTAPARVAAADVPRHYRNDWFFQLAVDEMSMSEASRAAGVPIGGAVGENGWDADFVSNFVPGHYTSITPTNEMKWLQLLRDEAILGDYDFTKADRYVDFAVASGVQIRGHVLVWGVKPDKTYPQAVKTQVEASEDPRTTLIEIMREHIHTVALHFGDKVDVWDVVNEHFISRYDDNIFYTVLGEDYVKIAFELAREVLPTTPLVWNEVVNDYSMDSQLIIDWLDMLQRYKDEGVPIDRIGVQGHEYNTLQGSRLDDLATFLRTVADMGYGVEVTEYDAPLTMFVESNCDIFLVCDILDIFGNPFHDPYKAQADYTARYLKACLDSGRCEGFTAWGITDADTWLDRHIFASQAPNLPLLIDQDGFPKPAWLSVRRELEAFAAPPTIFDWFFDLIDSIWTSFSEFWTSIFG